MERGGGQIRDVVILWNHYRWNREAASAYKKTFVSGEMAQENVRLPASHGPCPETEVAIKVTRAALRAALPFTF